MSNLYQISQDYYQIVTAIIESGGEITPEQEQALEITRQDLQLKGEGYAAVINSLESESEVIDMAIKRLQERKKARQNQVDRLKERLKEAMILFEVKAVKTPLFSFSLRESESVEVGDVEALHQDYVTVKITKQPDKARIKDAIKCGIEVPGASIKINTSLQIR